ncbi:hypothetical protein PCE1_004322 [Barthelona sp. PCE]
MTSELISRLAAESIEARLEVLEQILSTTSVFEVTDTIPAEAAILCEMLPSTKDEMVFENGSVSGLSIPPHLKKLSLKFITIQDWGQFAHSIADSTLEELHMVSCGIDSTAMSVLASNLPYSLCVLNLSFNPLGNTGLGLLLVRLDVLPSMRELVLRACSIDIDGARLLSRQRISFEKLDLSGNSITSFASDFFHFPSLRILYLRNCGLDDNFLGDYIAEGTLKELYIGANSFTTRATEDFLRRVHPQLQVLDIWTSTVPVGSFDISQFIRTWQGHQLWLRLPVLSEPDAVALKQSVSVNSTLLEWHCCENSREINADVSEAIQSMLRLNAFLKKKNDNPRKLFESMSTEGIDTITDKFTHLMNQKMDGSHTNEITVPLDEQITRQEVEERFTGMCESLEAVLALKTGIDDRVELIAMTTDKNTTEIRGLVDGSIQRQTVLEHNIQRESERITNVTDELGVVGDRASGNSKVIEIVQKDITKLFDETMQTIDAIGLVEETLLDKQGDLLKHLSGVSDNLESKMSSNQQKLDRARDELMLCVTTLKEDVDDRVAAVHKELENHTMAIMERVKSTDLERIVDGIKHVVNDELDSLRGLVESHNEDIITFEKRIVAFANDIESLKEYMHADITAINNTISTLASKEALQAVDDDVRAVKMGIEQLKEQVNASLKQLQFQLSSDISDVVASVSVVNERLDAIEVWRGEHSDLIAANADSIVAVETALNEHVAINQQEFEAVAEKFSEAADAATAAQTMLNTRINSVADEAALNLSILDEVVESNKVQINNVNTKVEERVSQLRTAMDSTVEMLKSENEDVLRTVSENVDDVKARIETEHLYIDDTREELVLMIQKDIEDVETAMNMNINVLAEGIESFKETMLKTTDETVSMVESNTLLIEDVREETNEFVLKHNGEHDSLNAQVACANAHITDVVQGLSTAEHDIAEHSDAILVINKELTSVAQATEIVDNSVKDLAEYLQQSFNTVKDDVDTLDESMNALGTELRSSFEGVRTDIDIVDNAVNELTEFTKQSFTTVKDDVDTLDESMNALGTELRSSFEGVRTDIDIVDNAVNELTKHTQESFNKVVADVELLDKTVTDMFTKSQASFDAVQNDVNILDKSVCDMNTKVKESFDNVEEHVTVLDTNVSEFFEKTQASFDIVQSDVTKLDCAVQETFEHVQTSFDTVRKDVDAVTEHSASVEAEQILLKQHVNELEGKMLSSEEFEKNVELLLGQFDSKLMEADFVKSSDFNNAVNAIHPEIEEIKSEFDAIRTVISEHAEVIPAVSGATEDVKALRIAFEALSGKVDVLSHKFDRFDGISTTLEELSEAVSSLTSRIDYQDTIIKNLEDGFEVVADLSTNVKRVDEAVITITEEVFSEDRKKMHKEQMTAFDVFSKKYDIELREMHAAIAANVSTSSEVLSNLSKKISVLHNDMKIVHKRIRRFENTVLTHEAHALHELEDILEHKPPQLGTPRLPNPN